MRSWRGRGRGTYVGVHGDDDVQCAGLVEEREVGSHFSTSKATIQEVELSIPTRRPSARIEYLERVGNTQSRDEVLRDSVEDDGEGGSLGRERVLVGLGSIAENVPRSSHHQSGVLESGRALVVRDGTFLEGRAEVVDGNGGSSDRRVVDVELVRVDLVLLSFSISTNLKRLGGGRRTMGDLREVLY